MDVRLFAFLARQPSARVKDRERFFGLPKRGLAFVLANAMFWQPLLVQAAEGIAVSAPGTSVGQAGNGVPVINIAKPNGSGLSHNRFNEYNVGKQGVILNNATSRTQATQLGGIILGNPNLKKGAAKVILNEVGGSSASQLNGYTEVAGKSAHVIVANPYGITCDGCGFINAPRATLTTGKPVLQDGRLDHLQVDGGSVTFEGAGFRADKVEQFDVITRSTQINAQIHARKLNVITGRNDVKLDDLSSVARADDGSAAPELAIDSSALGGMYAGSIRLVGTEKGVGVRLRGDMATSAGDIQLDANGKLTVGQAVASKAVKINAQSVQADGAVYAGSTLDINAQGDVDSRKSLAAQGRIQIQSGGQLSNAGSIDAGVNLNGKRNAAGDVSLSAKQVVNRGTVIASRKLDISAGDALDNQGATLVAREVELKAARIDNRDGQITASGGAAKVHAGQQLDNRNGKLLAGSDLQLSGGQVLNQAGALVADTLGAKVQSLDNSDGGRVSAEKGKLSISTQGELRNQNGRLQATVADVELKAASIDNRAGVVVGRQLQVDAGQGLLDNRAGQVLGSKVQLQAASIDNSEQGIVLAGSEGLTVDAGQVNNRLGTLLADGSALVMRLGQGTLDSQGGTLKGAQVAISAGALDNSAQGVLASLKGNLELTVGRIDNRGGLIESSRSLTVDGEQLDNSAGGQLRAVAGEASHLALAAALNNSAGTLAIGSSSFNLATASLNNTAGNIEYAGQGPFALNLGSLQGQGGRLATLGSGDWRIDRIDGAGSWQLNGGLTLTSSQGLTLLAGDRIASAGGMLFNAASLDNGGELIADGGLTFSVAGDMRNSGTISTLQGVQIDAANLTQVNGQIASGGDIRLSLRGNLDNLGRLVANQALTVDAARIDNRGTLGALRAVNLNSPDGVYNQQDSLLFSGGPLQVRGGTLSNYYGDIYSAGALSFAGLDGGQASLFSNLSGSVESAGALDIDALEVVNAKAEFELGKVLTSGSIRWVCGQHCHGRDSFKRGAITIVKVFNEQAIKDSPAARLVSGQNLTVNAQHIENRYSLMAANGDMTVNADSLLNQGAVSRTGQQVIKQGTPGRINTAYWDRMEYIDVPAFNAAVAAGNFDAARFEQLVSRSAGSGFNIGSDVTTWSPDGNTLYAATLQAGGNVALNVRQNIQNGSLLDNTLAQLTGTLGDNQLSARVGGIDLAVNPALAPAQQTKDVTRVEHVAADGTLQVSFVPADFSGSPFATVDPTALPTFRLPEGDYGLFTQVRDPKGQYLIETNPQLTNLKNFYSSDYLLDQLDGVDEQQAWRRLGDGGYETRLVSDAVLAQTGQRFLANGLTSEYDQFRYLMDNAIASRDALGLSLGVGLSASQVAALTHDIVWMEEREVQGQKVLAPVLYLAKVDTRDIRGGSLIQGRDVSVLAGNDLTSVGTLRASNDLSVVTGNSIYQGGLAEAGNRLSMVAQNSIRNAMAGDIRGAQVDLSAVNGDIVNDRTAILVGDGSGYRTVLDDGARISATGSLSLGAGQDISNKSQITAGGDVALKAGGNINLLAVTDASEDHVIRDGGHNNSIITRVKQLGASVSSGGNLVIQAGGDVNAVASKATAAKDLTVVAGGDLYLSSAGDEDSVETHSKHGKKRITEIDSHTRQVASEFSAGGNLLAVAGQDVTLVASNLKAGEALAVNAGNRLQLLAAQNSDHTLYDMKEKGSFGKLKLQRDEVTQVTHVGSQLQSGGDLALTSGGDQRYQVALLQSGGDLKLDSGGAIVFEGVKDLHDESHTKTDNDAFWNSAKGKGSTDETLRQTQMQAAGEITIKAVENLRIDIRQVNQQTVSQTIDAMVKADPKLAWIKAAEQRGDVDWRRVKEIHDSFKYNNSGLGPASQLIIAIAMSLVLGPAGLQMGGVGLAGASSLATTATVSTINNKGDLGAAFKDTFSANSLKNAATSMVVAGFAEHLIDPNMSGGDAAFKSTNGFDLSTLEGVGGYSLRAGALGLTSGAVGTAINGGSLGDNVLNGMVSQAGSVVAAVAFNNIGNFAENQLEIARANNDSNGIALWSEGGAARVALHAMIGGAVSSATGGDFVTGAAAAGANQVMAGVLKGSFESQPEIREAFSQMIGLASAGLVGGDMEKGAWVAQMADRFNRQAHPEEIRLIKKEAEALAKAQGISSAEAEQRLAQAFAYYTDKQWHERLGKEGLVIESSTLDHLSSALAPLAERYDVAWTSDVPQVPGADKTYTPEQTRALLQDFSSNHSAQYSDSRMYGEHLLYDRFGNFEEYAEYSEYYKNNLNFATSDLGADAVGAGKGVGDAVGSMAKGIYDLASGLVTTPEQTTNGMLNALMKSAANPDEVVEAYFQARQDKDVQAALYRLQGNPEAAARIEMEWETNFYLNFIPASRVVKLGQVAKVVAAEEKLAALTGKELADGKGIAGLPEWYRDASSLSADVVKVDGYQTVVNSKTGNIEYLAADGTLYLRSGDELRPKVGGNLATLAAAERDILASKGAGEAVGGTKTAVETSARSLEQLLPDGKVPSVRGGEFNRWFDELSSADLDVLWQNKAAREAIEARIRQPGGLHEWCMVCRAPDFKAWGVPMEEIQRFRTKTTELKWVSPVDRQPGGHGGHASGTFHNELKAVIDNSKSLDEFNVGIITLRDRWQIKPSLLPSLPRSGGL